MHAYSKKKKNLAWSKQPVLASKEMAPTWIWHHKRSDTAGTTVCPLNPFVPTRIDYLHVGAWEILTSDQQTQNSNSKRKCLFLQKAHFHLCYSSRQNNNQLRIKGREDVNISYTPILEGGKLTASTNKGIMCLNMQLSLRNRWRGWLNARPASWYVLKRRIRTAETEWDCKRVWHQAAS